MLLRLLEGPSALQVEKARNGILSSKKAAVVVICGFFTEGVMLREPWVRLELLVRQAFRGRLALRVFQGRQERWVPLGHQAYQAFRIQAIRFRIRNTR